MTLKSAIRTDSQEYKDSAAAMKKLVGNLKQNLAMIEQAKFRKPVVPGDQLRLEMKVDKLKTSIAKMSGEATVDGSVVAEATVMCKLGPKAE